MTQLELSKIRLDGGTQPRAQMDLFTVADYAEAMREGIQFPPVTVFYDDLEYWLADGFHRIGAAIRANLKTIEADVRQGQRRDAVLFSVGANSDHGLRRTNEDKRRSVETMLNDEEWARWSDGEIARRCNVTQPFVSGLRKTYTHNDYEYKNGGSQERVFTHPKTGQATVMNTASIGKQPSPAAPVQATLLSTQDSPLPPNTNGHHKPESTPQIPDKTIAVTPCPFWKDDELTVYNGDFRDLIEVLPDGFIVTDPPYNVGFKYDIYQDNLTDADYIEMISALKRFKKIAIIQYPEDMQRLIIPALGPPDHTSVWCYNSNINRRFRLINWYGVTPDYSRVKQPYKNPTDRRVRQLMAEGHIGASLYEWWDDIQIVKNVSIEKGNHPCPVPEKLMKRIITLGAEPGEIILDPFAGELTTLKAAKDLGYRAIGVELSKEYILGGIERLRQSLLQIA